MWNLENYIWKGIWELSNWTILCCLGSLGSDRKAIVFKRLPVNFKQLVLLFGLEQQISSYYFSRKNEEKRATTSMTKISWETIQHQLNDIFKPEKELNYSANEPYVLCDANSTSAHWKFKWYNIYPSHLEIYKSSQVILSLILTNCVFLLSSRNLSIMVPEFAAPFYLQQS